MEIVKVELCEGACHSDRVGGSTCTMKKAALDIA